MHVIEDESEVVIVLPAEFTFDSHQSFRSAYMVKSKQLNFVVDFSQVTLVDSSALGALLILKEYANSPVTLRGAQGSVSKILKMAHFDTLFTVEP
ncbi:MAG: STAS domain-containing protein [Magnetococcales bacterium]|nr:STAS domain-containing protein [Magnetococcales bacterium]